MGANPLDAENGKSPQTDAEPGTKSDDFSKRLHASTFGLMSDAFVGSGAATGTALASSTAEGEGKGEASRGSAGPKDSSIWAQGGSRSSASNYTCSQATLQDGVFRSRVGEDAELQAQRELDGFQAAQEGDWMNEDQLSYLGNGKGKESESKKISGGGSAVGDAVAYERVWKENKSRRFPLHAALAEKEDGADVIALLSDPKFQPGLSYKEVMSLAGEGVEGEEDPFELSPAEMEFIGKLKATLPPADLNKTPLPANPLNLIPDYRTQDDLGSESRFDLQATTPLHVDESYLYHSTNSSSQPTGIGLEPIPGLEPWFEVINSYHEDVWGYLKPYVQAAKQEVEKAEEQREPTTTSGPAVRRLGMILAHLDEEFKSRKRPGQ